MSRSELDYRQWDTHELKLHMGLIQDELNTREVLSKHHPSGKPVPPQWQVSKENHFPCRCSLCNTKKNAVNRFPWFKRLFKRYKGG